MRVIRAAVTTFATVATILAGSAVGAAPKPRTEVVPYSRVGEVEVDSWIARCGGAGFAGGGLGMGRAWEIASFWADRGERSMSIKVADRAPAQHVMAFVQYLNRHNAWTGTVICGATTKPISIDDDQAISVWVLEGTSDQGPSIPTSGRVVATIYR